jgi:tRNA(fMet)-specific endonuclease VapC
LVDIERGFRRLEDLAHGEDQAISVVTVSELLHGAYRAHGARRTRRRAFLEHVLARLEPVPITEAVARIHADVWAALARRGAMIGAHDLWIAATGLARGAGVVTTDVRDFSRVPGLRVLGA